MEWESDPFIFPKKKLFLYMFGGRENQGQSEGDG